MGGGYMLFIRLVLLYTHIKKVNYINFFFFGFRVFKTIPSDTLSSTSFYLPLILSNSPPGPLSLHPFFTQSSHLRRSLPSSLFPIGGSLITALINVLFSANHGRLNQSSLLDFPRNTRSLEYILELIMLSSVFCILLLQNYDMGQIYHIRIFYLITSSLSSEN